MSEDRPASGSVAAQLAMPSPRTWPGKVSPPGRCLGIGRTCWLTSARAPGRVFAGVGHNLPQEAPQAHARAVVNGDGFQPRKTEKPSHD
jgi:hypothetical protein